MMRWTTTHPIAVAFLPMCCVAVAAVHASAQDDRVVREAATRAVELVEQTSAKFLDTRKCFTCHTQTLSAMVLRDAHGRGFEIDQQNLKRQSERAATLHRFTKTRKPADIRIDTVGYGLWALDIGRHARDAMTEDMTWYLLNFDPDLGHWQNDRSPTADRSQRFYDELRRDPWTETIWHGRAA